MSPGNPDSGCWITADLGIAGYLSANGFTPTIEVPPDQSALSRFSFDNASGQLNTLILSWGSGGQIDAAGYWAALNDLKARIRGARREANQR